MKKVIIEIRCSENEMVMDITGECNALEAMLAAVRLLLETEQKLPEDMRADFRADFLEELNRQRREEMKDIENR